MDALSIIALRQKSDKDVASNLKTIAVSYLLECYKRVSNEEGLNPKVKRECELLYIHIIIILVFYF